MRYEGKVYRPWPEAESILIQVTLGCTINTCTFCNMFRDKRFKVRDLEGIFADIEQARRVYPEVRSLFLIDGNVMAIRTELLLKILNKITETFPEIQNISMYAGFNDLRRKSDADLLALKQAGLDMVYTGLESGDPVVLERIKKGMTAEHALEGMAKAKKAGIRVLASFIFGLGGKLRSKEHIEATTALLNQMQPEEIAPMALAIQPGTEMEQEVQQGTFLLPTPLQVLEEEQYLLENLEEFDCYYWGDHGNNIAPMRGMLPRGRSAFLDRIEHEIATNPVTKQEVIKTFAW
ncbi:radical SAM protein [Ferrimonas marina]|uniref:Radical SAM superfamily protein n=1 Tax=Ferrimonas marina TaxID=299255 RepID=A0A1M5RE03_9GAMM|nr:radical SAM protein [Ferrimonas marina]SHH24524.1 Radical SAM superfamily protein [Ferrimonas marina]